MRRRAAGQGWRSGLVAGLALLVWVSVAGADEAFITAFDGNGRLTIGALATGASCRVEWATHLDPGAWSSTAPGIAATAPSTGTTLTVTVGVSHAACFYRVVASVTNPPPPELTSAFGVDSEGWRTVNYPFRSHVPNPATGDLSSDAGFGNPAGSVRVGDVYAETGISGPAAYLGNKLPYYGGSLSYDIYIRYTDNVPYPGVVLNGGSLSIYHDAPSPPLNTWERRTVPLTEAGWKVCGTGLDATEGNFREVLGTLGGLYIYTEWHSGADDTSVDNIALAPP